MILVYPMLVSQAVSENVIPGISKTLENYIIVYSQDDIISNPAVRQRNLNFKIEKGRFVARESVELNEAESGGSEIMNIGIPGPRSSSSNVGTTGGSAIKSIADIGNKIDYLKSEKEKAEKEAEELRKKLDRIEQEKEKLQSQADKNKLDREKFEHQKKKDVLDRKYKELDALEKRAEDERKEAIQKDKEEKEKLEKAKRVQSSIKLADNKAMSIEPSYMTIDYIDGNGNRRNEFIGVKVLPLRVKSDEKLSRLILHDTQLNFFSASLVSLGRRITKQFYGTWGRFMRKLGVQQSPTAEARYDIFMAMSGHNGEGFVVLSKNEDIDETFLSNISKLNRLFRMGWGNIVVVDDINRVAYFCMKKFKGVCSAISFSVMYNNFGSLKVYETLEDAKRQNTSVFKIRKGFSKVVSEWITEYRQSNYLNEEKDNG